MENYIQLTYEQYAELAKIGGKNPVENARKRIKDKYGFPTKITELEVNGKRVGKAVALIPESHYNELLRGKDLKEFSGVTSGVVSGGGNEVDIDNVQEAEFETVSDLNSDQKNNEFSSMNINKIIDKLETASYKVGYLEGVLNQLEPKVKLLETSESKTKEEFFRISQENKQLTNEKVELLAKIESLNEKLKQQDQSKLNNWFKRL